MYIFTVVKCLILSFGFLFLCKVALLNDAVSYA